MAQIDSFPGIGERIALAVQKVGGQGRAAELVSASRASIQKWRTDSARPPLLEIYLLAREAGVSLEWIVSGIEPIGDGAGAIPRYSPDALGNPARQPVDADTLAVHKDFFSVHRLNPQRTGIVRVVGDAMSPDINDGALVIIDMRSTNFTDEGLWVLGRPGATLVRRLQFDGECARLKAANPNYSDIIVRGGDPFELKIWGRVSLILSAR